jgi:transcriptional regulator with XRE-family HTH domain
MIDVNGDWEEQVEKNIELASLGEKIRRLRRTRSMGLVELGKQTGLSPSFLSQLETGRAIPTLRHLALIALLFNKELEYFFTESRQSNFRISRGKTRSRLAVKKKTGLMFSESMSVLIPDRSVVPCLAEFPLEEADASFFPDIFEGEEFVYVLSGSVAVLSGLNEKTLDEGDVLWVSGSSAREYRCKAGQTAKLMIVTRPVGPEERVVRKVSR